MTYKKKTRGSAPPRPAPIAFFGRAERDRGDQPGTAKAPL